MKFNKEIIARGKLLDCPNGAWREGSGVEELRKTREKKGKMVVRGKPKLKH